MKQNKTEKIGRKPEDLHKSVKQRKQEKEDVAKEESSVKIQIVTMKEIHYAFSVQTNIVNPILVKVRLSVEFVKDGMCWSVR